MFEAGALQKQGRATGGCLRGAGKPERTGYCLGLAVTQPRMTERRIFQKHLDLGIFFYIKQDKTKQKKIFFKNGPSNFKHWSEQISSPTSYRGLLGCHTESQGETHPACCGDEERGVRDEDINVSAAFKNSSTPDTDFMGQAGLKASISTNAEMTEVLKERPSNPLWFSGPEFRLDVSSLSPTLRGFQGSLAEEGSGLWRILVPSPSCWSVLVDGRLGNGIMLVCLVSLMVSRVSRLLSAGSASAGPRASGCVGWG